MAEPGLDHVANRRGFAVTHGVVLRLAVPMTAAYLSVPLAGLVDTAVIGQIGIAALIGGIAIGAVILNILFTTCNFLRAGTTGLTAQAFGAGDEKERQAVLGRALIIALVIGLAIVVAQRPLIATGLWLMHVGPEVESAAGDYLAVRIWATPFVLANFVLVGWLLGVARPGTVLLLQMIFAALNIGLSLLFVLHLGWGVAGVAWASVFAEAVTVVLTLPFVIRLLPAGSRPSRRRIFDRVGFVRIIAVNRDIMIRSFSLLFAFAVFTRQGAQFGDVVLAANAVLMHLFLIGGYFLDGLATAAEQLAGRAVGARYRPAFRTSVRLTLIWGFTLSLALTVIYLIAGRQFIALMTTAPEVRASAEMFLVWAALTPLAGVLAFQMDGVFIGATWSSDMRSMMLVSLAVYLAALAVLIPALGNHGLWLALLLFLGVRGLSLFLRLRRREPETFGGAGASAV
jgi:MATE family multidrug resistance protein